jgi:hypothetical protein
LGVAVKQVSYFWMLLLIFGAVSGCAGKKYAHECLGPASQCNPANNLTYRYIMFSSAEISRLLELKKDMLENFKARCEEEAASFSYMKCLSKRARAITPRTARFFPIYGSMLVSLHRMEGVKKNSLKAAFELASLMHSDLDEFTKNHMYLHVVDRAQFDPEEFDGVVEMEKETIASLRQKNYQVQKKLVIKIKNALRTRPASLSPEENDRFQEEVGALEKKIDGRLALEAEIKP